MKKKQTEKEKPEQEQESPAEEQETEETAEEEVEVQDESDTQELEEQETEDQQDEEPNAEQNPDAAEQEQPAADQNGESANLKSALLEAQGKLAAYAAGVAPDMIADAVTLAMAEASKEGEVTESSVTKAMDAVLKRHPEWRADSGSKSKSGGFRIGADRDSSGVKKQSGNAPQNVKRWNRYKN